MSPMTRAETIEVSNELVDNVESVSHTNDAQIISQKSKDGRTRKTNLSNKQVVEKELVVDVHDLVSQNSKVGRPRKIGKALENDNIVKKRNHHQKVGKTVGEI